MSSYHAADYTDLVTTTLRHLERGTWAELVVDTQRHIAMPYILQKKNVTFGGGYGHQFNVRFFSNNAAQNVKLNQEDNPTTADTQKTGTIPWRHSETHWAIEERIISMNSNSAEQLVDLVKTSRTDAWVDLAELMEANFWSGPTSSSDELTPYGVPVWIVKGSSTTGDFDGGNPTNGAPATAGGLDTDTYSRWKNWYCQYSSISKLDLIRKLREALTKTDFRPPIAGPFSNTQYKSVGEGANYNEGRRNCGVYTPYAVVSRVEEMLEVQNDSLGNDVASKDGMVTIRRIPMSWVPYLDANASSTLHGTNPVIGINWDNFKVAFLRGEYMRESKVKPQPHHHRGVVQYVDCTYNYFCNDRRSQFLLSQ